MSNTLYMTPTDNVLSKKLNTTYISENKWTSYQFCTWPKFQLSQEKYLFCIIIQGFVQLVQFLKHLIQWVETILSRCCDLAWGITIL